MEWSERELPFNVAMTNAEVNGIDWPEIAS
jgi:hypothetical protein